MGSTDFCDMQEGKSAELIKRFDLFTTSPSDADAVHNLPDKKWKYLENHPRQMEGNAPDPTSIV